MTQWWNYPGALYGADPGEPRTMRDCPHPPYNANLTGPAPVGHTCKVCGGWTDETLLCVCGHTREEHRFPDGWCTVDDYRCKCAEFVAAVEGKR